jgi:hypothetical protein
MDQKAEEHTFGQDHAYSQLREAAPGVTVIDACMNPVVSPLPHIPKHTEPKMRMDLARDAVKQAITPNVLTNNDGGTAVSGGQHGDAASNAPVHIEPLGDPVRRLGKWILRFLMAASVVLFLWTASTFTELDSGAAPLVIASIVVLFAMGPLFTIVFALFPRRPANALYLRSFRNDHESWPIRRTLQQAFGRKFRLSGIRDPRRRRSPLEYVAMAVFVLRYLTPKYMNLEAGSDWFQRLWRSLQEVRCVVVDVSELTPTVGREARLASESLAPDRILFVGDARHTSDEWRAQLAPYLPVGAAGQAHLLIWDGTTHESRRRFARQVEEFARQVPKTLAGDEMGRFIASYSLVQREDARSESDASQHHVGILLGAQFGVGVAAALLGAIVAAASPSAGTAFSIIVNGVIYSIIAWYLLLYFLHGTRRQRIVAVLLIVGTATYYVGVVGGMLSAVQSARGAAQRNMALNHLKQIGVGAQNHLDSTRSFPPRVRYRGYPRNDATLLPIHSWQTALLPFIEENYLFDRIDFSKPWDDEANEEVFGTIVEPYLSPPATTLRSETNHAVSHFAGNANVFDPTRLRRATGEIMPLSYQSFRDGTSKTFLAGEAEGAYRPWGDPGNTRDPAVGVKQGPNSYGRPGMEGTLLIMADGSVRSISSDVDPEVFKAMGTPAGGETIPLELDR